MMRFQSGRFKLILLFYIILFKMWQDRVCLSLFRNMDGFLVLIVIIYKIIVIVGYGLIPFGWEETTVGQQVATHQAGGPVAHLTIKWTGPLGQ